MAGTSITNKSSFFHFNDQATGSVSQDPQSALNLFLTEKKLLKENYVHNKVNRLADSLHGHYDVQKLK